MKLRFLVQVQTVGTPLCTGYRVTAENHTDAWTRIQNVGTKRGLTFKCLGIYQIDEAPVRADETRARLLLGALA